MVSHMCLLFALWEVKINMDRCNVELTEGELIVMKMLVRGDQIPINRNRVLNSLRRKINAITINRVKSKEVKTDDSLVSH